MHKWWIFRWNVALPEGKDDSLHVSIETRRKYFSAKFECIHSENNIRLEQALGVNRQWDLSSRKGIKLQDALAPRITELFHPAIMEVEHGYLQPPTIRKFIRESRSPLPSS